MSKVRKVCKHCGSEDVRKDAWAEWNEDKQEWVLAHFCCRVKTWESIFICWKDFERSAGKYEF